MLIIFYLPGITVYFAVRTDAVSLKKGKSHISCGAGSIPLNVEDFKMKVVFYFLFF